MRLQNLFLRSSTVDKRALKILHDTFWSPAGWKPEGQRLTAPVDLAYAKSMGVMLDSVRLDHAQAVGQLTAFVERLDRRRVADAFLASLSTRRLDWRSALGSYAVFQHFTPHVPVERERHCAVCGFFLNDDPAGEDLNLLNFERWKWGGVRHDRVIYAWLDLQLFVRAEAPEPTAGDQQTFRRLIETIAQVPPRTTSAALHAHFARLLRSNKAERDVIVAILGFCGILAAPDHPGFHDAFVPVGERHLPNRHFTDMAYPACWWQGSDCVNETALQAYFGHAL